MIMALHFDTSGCQDSAALWEGDQRPITDVIAFATIAVDMGQITEDNIEKFAARLEKVAEVYGGSLLQSVQDGKLVDVPVTVDILRPYIGARANVATTTDAQFRGKMTRAKNQRAKDAAWAAQRAAS
jgi:hypothetical protein